MTSNCLICHETVCFITMKQCLIAMKHGFHGHETHCFILIQGVTSPWKTLFIVTQGVSWPWNTVSHPVSSWFKLFQDRETKCLILIQVVSRPRNKMSHPGVWRCFLAIKQIVSLLIHPDWTCFNKVSSIWFISFHADSTCVITVTPVGTVIFHADSTCVISSSLFRHCFASGNEPWCTHKSTTLPKPLVRQNIINLTNLFPQLVYRFLDNSTRLAMGLSISVCLFRSHKVYLGKIKIVKMTFIDFDVRHRMVPLRELWSLTLTYFSNVKQSNRNLPQRRTPIQVWRVRVLLYY